MGTGEWTNPRNGESHTLTMDTHTRSEVLAVAKQSLLAWESFRYYPPKSRGRVLRIIADALDSHSEQVVALADEESALGAPRLTGEVTRTSFQLRMFAHALEQNELLPSEVDGAVEGGPPAGRPELVRHHVPLGPVAVFGASNFPFAFGVLGGDFASALAAGCTVVAKEHHAHPRLSLRLVEIAREALRSAAEDPDLILSIRGTEAGAELVTAPEIAAVGFTGSVSGGRFLFDLAVSRPKPIPFYGELGSVNPVFISREAAESRAEEIGTGFVDSLLLGAGQFCTKPSVLFFPEGSAILSHVVDALKQAKPMPLLTPRIAEAYREQVQKLLTSNAQSLLTLPAPQQEGAWVVPFVFQTSVDEMLSGSSPLAEECFGPAAVVVAYSTDEEALALARQGEGALVGCVHGEMGDQLAGTLVKALATRMGRVVWNGWPTGVSVAPAQMHGGPYPAATVPGATSVGLHAAARFSRPVVFQSVPIELQPSRVGL